MSYVIVHACGSKYFCHVNATAMSVIIVLLLASISVAALFLGGFIWSVKSGQYDDEDSPPVRMLFDNRQQELTPKEGK